MNLRDPNASTSTPTGKAPMTARTAAQKATEAKAVSSTQITETPAPPPILKAEEELELKLRVPPEALNRFKVAPKIRSLTTGRAVTQKLENVYYDTPDDQLAAAGVSLRVRKKSRSYEQTIKVKASQKAGLFKRLEWNKPLSSLSPILTGDDMPKELQKIFGKASLRDAIGPRFMVKQSRTIRMLSLPEATTEMALDIVDITTPAGKKMSYVEVEFELKTGRAVGLYDLALDLIDSYALTLSQFSKADEGMRLLRNTTPKGVKLPAPVLKTSDTVQQSFQRIIDVCSAQIMANEDAILARTDIEGVHQIRVALRRLRSGFTLFRPALKSPDARHLMEELKWLADSFGDARDTDVFLAETLPPVFDAHEDHLGLLALKRQAKRLNDQAYAQAQAVLKSPRYVKLLLTLAKWNESPDEAWHGGDMGAEALLGAPISGFADQLLQNRHKKVMRLGRRLETLSIERKHDLRLLVKKFRYAGDFFSSLYPNKKVKPFNKDLAGLQESLGALNDIAVAGDLVRRLAQASAQKDSKMRAPALEAAGIVIGWNNRAAQEKVNRLVQEWRPFAQRAPYWHK